MALSKTAKYYRDNPAARKRRLEQQKDYDTGNPRIRSKRSPEEIKKYHRALSKWNRKNKAKKAAAKAKNGGKPVDAVHSGGRITFGDRKHNRGNEVRKRNKPSNK